MNRLSNVPDKSFCTINELKTTPHEDRFKSSVGASNPPPELFPTNDPTARQLDPLDEGDLITPLESLDVTDATGGGQHRIL